MSRINFVEGLPVAQVDTDGPKMIEFAHGRPCFVGKPDLFSGFRVVFRGGLPTVLGSRNAHMRDNSIGETIDDLI